MNVMNEKRVRERLVEVKFVDLYESQVVRLCDK
jgi:hypothetical protein